MKFKIFTILIISFLIVSLSFVGAEVSTTISEEQIAEAKISSGLLEVIEQNPEERVNIIIVPEAGKSVHTLGLCSWCNTIAWLCKIANWLCELFCGTDFELKAITADGYIIGSIPAKNINKLVESEHVKAILPDYYTIARLNSMEANVIKELEDMDKDIITIKPIIENGATVEQIVVPNVILVTGHTIQVEDYTIRSINIEKPKFLKIISIPWAKPQAKISISDGSKITTQVVKEDSEFKLGEIEVEVGEIKDNQVSFNVR